MSSNNTIGACVIKGVDLLDDNNDLAIEAATFNCKVVRSAVQPNHNSPTWDIYGSSNDLTGFMMFLQVPDFQEVYTIEAVRPANP